MNKIHCDFCGENAVKEIIIINTNLFILNVKYVFFIKPV